MAFLAARAAGVVGASKTSTGKSNQLSCKDIKLFMLSVCKTIFDDERFPKHVASLTKPCFESITAASAFRCGSNPQVSDPDNLSRRLCPCGKRPSRTCTAKKRDELAPLHCQSPMLPSPSVRGFRRKPKRSDVRSGSNPEKLNASFALESRHCATQSACPFRAQCRSYSVTASARARNSAAYSAIFLLASAGYAGACHRAAPCADPLG